MATPASSVPTAVPRPERPNFDAADEEADRQSQEDRELRMFPKGMSEIVHGGAFLSGSGCRWPRLVPIT